MWRFTGKIIFPKWQNVCQNNVKLRSATQNENNGITVSPDSKKSSHGESDGQQHANKKQHRFSEDPQFQSHTFCNNALETMGVVGVAALCVDMHRKLLQMPVRDGRKSCIFSNWAFAMPNIRKLKSLRNEAGAIQAIDSLMQPLKSDGQLPRTSKVDSLKIKNSSDGLLTDLNQVTVHSISSMENSIGIALSKHDKTQAYQFFKASAQLGCPKGLYNLALCYEMGSGTKKNFKKAARYYEQAALKNHASATYNLAVYTLQGIGGVQCNKDKGIKLMRTAADQGVNEAQVYLGVKYLEEKDYSAAYKLFKQAATQNTSAKYYLGLCYENGWGVARNGTAAAEMYAQAAQLGHEEATLKLGLFSENGSCGIDPNEDFSMTLYRMLADKGHEGGQKAMKALKEKQALKYNVKGFRNNVAPLSLIRNSFVIHTSASVPELKKYEANNSITQNVRSPSLMSLQPYNSVLLPLNLLFSTNYLSSPTEVKEPRYLNSLAIENTLKMPSKMSWVISAKS